MNNVVIDYLRDFNYVSIVLRLVLAVLCGGVVGFERERHGRAAGLRTHILVCLGAATTTLIGQFDMVLLPGYAGDPMRLGAQVISGIGFLGVGTILSKGRFQVTGLTTAAGLWTTGAIGLAIGIGFYEAALLATLFAAITMTLISRFDHRVIEHSQKFRVYIETDTVNNISGLLELLETQYHASDMQVTTPRSGISGNTGIEATVIIGRSITQNDIIQTLIADDRIIFALQSI